jgi:hypothetical protein
MNAPTAFFTKDTKNTKDTKKGTGKLDGLLSVPGVLSALCAESVTRVQRWQ